MLAAAQNALFRILILNDPENSFPRSPHIILTLFLNHVYGGKLWGLHSLSWLESETKEEEHSAQPLGADRLARPCLCLSGSHLNQFLSCPVSLSTHWDQDWGYLLQLVGGLSEIKYIKCLGEHLELRKCSPSLHCTVFYTRKPYQERQFKETAWKRMSFMRYCDHFCSFHSK